MASRKRVLTVLVAAMSTLCSPIAYAEGANISRQPIGDKLYAAFGNDYLFSDIANEFVDNSSASFSCKWWVMQASARHSEDIFQLNTQGLSPQAAPMVIAGLQQSMMEVIFKPLNYACNR